MFEPSLLLSGAVNWLLTYAIHSTVLVCAVWLITTGGRWLSPSTRDVLWKLALIGPLLTTSVQVAAGLEPVSWAIALDTGGEGARASTPVAGEPVAGEPVAGAKIAQRRHTFVTDRGSWTMVFEPDPSAVEAVATPIREGAPKWPWVLLALWLGGAGLCGAGLVRRAVRLRRDLADRKEVVEDPVLEAFLTLCQQAGISRKIRLTSAPGLTAPVSWGRSEICIPERSLTALSSRQMQAMLARQLGRLERRDPLWSGAALVIEALFFFQPLERLTRHELEKAADRSCDAWAARHCAPTGAQSGAQSGALATLAGEQRSVPEGGATHVAMAVGLLAATTWLAPGVVPAQVPASVHRPSTPAPAVSVAHVDAPPPAPRTCGHACDLGGSALRIRAHSHGFDGDFDFDFDVDFDLDVDVDEPHRHPHAHRTHREHMRWLHRLEEHDHLEGLVEQLLRDAMDE